MEVYSTILEVVLPWCKCAVAGTVEDDMNFPKTAYPGNYQCKVASSGML